MTIDARCLDENTIGALLDEELSSDDVVRVDDHVAACSRCRSLVASVVRLFPRPAPADVEPDAQIDPDGAEAFFRRMECERRLGAVLAGGWRLDRLLGGGRLTDAYAATCEDGQRAAIKILRPEWNKKLALVARFLREGYVANTLAHPGVPKVFADAVTDDGLPFLVLELLEGRTAAEQVESTLTAPEVLRVAERVLEVLAAAHAQGIVHGALRPESVFLQSDGSVKVLDFGIAAVQSLTNDPALSQVDSPYRAPEERDGVAADALADVWSLGAILFALLSGAPPELTSATGARAAPRLRSVCPAMAPDICEIVDRAIAVDRAERWDGANAMRTAVAAARVRLRGAARKASQDFRDERTFVIRRPRRPLTTAAMAFVVFVVTVGVLLGALLLYDRLVPS